MKRFPLVLSAVIMASVATAAEFDPSQFGLPGRPDPVYCSFWKNAAEGSKKFWKCSNGKVYFGEKNIWGIDGEPPLPTPPEDPTIKLKDGVLLRVRTVADRPYCEQKGRRHYCSTYFTPSFNYLMTSGTDQCEYLGPRIAAQEYVKYRELSIAVKIEWDCQG